MLTPSQYKSPSKKGTTSMRRFSFLATTILAVSTVMFQAAPAHSQPAVPKYLHALSDLRAAHGWLEADRRPELADLRHSALKEIEKAVDEVKKAAKDDGRNLNFTPPPQQSSAPGGMVHTALDLLDRAYQDVNTGTDIPQNAGVQTKALQHIAAARAAVQQMFKR